MEIAREPTLSARLTAIFATEGLPVEGVVAPPAPPEPEEPLAAAIADLIEQAQLHYNQALQYQKDGDWAGYGRELSALEAVLSQLAELAAEES